MKINNIKTRLNSRYSTLKTRVKNNPKLVGISILAVLTPLLVLGVFFYGDVTLQKITASFNASQKDSEEAETPSSVEASEENEEGKLDLRLISREDFIEQYSPKPAFLPQPTEINASLAGFLNSSRRIDLLPARNWGVPFVDIEASSALAVTMPDKRIIYGKNVFERRPIASLSKLMTALVAVEQFNLEETLTVPQDAIDTEGSAGNLIAGEKLTVRELLYAMMLESSNDAAVTLENSYNSRRSPGDPDFVSLMNQKARELNLGSTVFAGSVGLKEQNKSNSFQVAQLLFEAFQNENLAKIMKASSFSASPANKEITHYWINLNALLGEEHGVLGGKTGFTDEAGPSMALVAETPHEDRYVVTVVLDAEDRVAASRQLLSWVNKAYIWKE